MDENLSGFWQAARSIRLTEAESGQIKAALVISTENTVRVKPSAGLQGRMDPKNLLHGAHDIRLSDKESGQIYVNILEYMEAHPVKESTGEQQAGDPSVGQQSILWESLHSLLFLLRPMPIASLLIAVVIAFSTGVSVMAQSALPGDFLYPVKVHVNENVEAALHVSPGSRARFEAERLEHRLEEAARLAAAGRLHGDVKNEMSGTITSQLERFQSLAAELAAEGGTDAALDLHSQVESDLLANTAVLSALADTKATDQEKEDVRDFLQNVTTVEHTATRTRTAAEAKVSGGAEADVKTAAEGSMSGAVNKIDEVRAFIDENSKSADGHVLAQANARFDLSKKILGEARTSLSAGKYADAFRFAREAQRTAQEAKVMLKVSAGLHLNLKAPPSADTNTPRARRSSSSIASTVSSDSSVSSVSSSTYSEETSANVDAHSNVDVKIDEGSVNVNQNGKVDVKLNTEL